MIFSALLTVYACQKSDGVINQPYATYGIDSSGLLKINIGSAYYADYATLTLKVNGVVKGTGLQQRAPFPGGGYNTRGSNYALYLAVPKGNDTISLAIPKVGTSIDSVVLYSTVINIPDNSPYTLHIADTLVNLTSNNTKSVLVKNPSTGMDTGYCKFRFVNLMPNLAAVDLYLNGILMKSNIPYLQTTDTFTVRTGVNAPGYSSATTTTWAVRPAGAAATSTALASYASANGLQSQRVLTIYSMGYSGGTGGKQPYLCFILDNNQ